MKKLIFAVLVLSLTGSALAVALGRSITLKTFRASQMKDGQDVPFTAAEVLAHSTFFDYINDVNRSQSTVILSNTNYGTREVVRINCHTPALALELSQQLVSGRVGVIALPFADAERGPERGQLGELVGVSASLVQKARAYETQEQGD